MHYAGTTSDVSACRMAEYVSLEMLAPAILKDSDYTHKHRKVLNN